MFTIIGVVLAMLTMCLYTALSITMVYWMACILLRIFSRHRSFVICICYILLIYINYCNWSYWTEIIYNILIN